MVKLSRPISFYLSYYMWFYTNPYRAKDVIIFEVDNTCTGACSKCPFFKVNSNVQLECALTTVLYRAKELRKNIFENSIELV